MIAALAALLVCQCLGEIIVRSLLLPLPGPVVGLAILFAALVVRGRRHPERTAVPPELGAVADTLLQHLSLLFIPAAVGVVQYLALLRVFAGRIAIVIAVSTALTLVVTALTFRFVSRLHSFRHKPVRDEVAAALDPGRHP